MKVLRACLLAAAAAATAVGSLQARAQSYNCRKAYFPDEKLICQSPELSRLDEQLAAVYIRVLNSLPGPAQRTLDRKEDDWVVARRRCGQAFDCIEAAYRRRLGELAGMLGERPDQDRGLAVSEGTEPRATTRRVAQPKAVPDQHARKQTNGEGRASGSAVHASRTSRAEPNAAPEALSGSTTPPPPSTESKAEEPYVPTRHPTIAFPPSAAVQGSAAPVPSSPPATASADRPRAEPRATDKSAPAGPLTPNR